MTLIPNINNQSIAILSDIEEWKKDIAAAINTKGGDSTDDESFQQLAEDIQTLPYAGISAEGIVQTNQFSFVGGLFRTYSSVTEIHDNTTTSFKSRLTYYNANGSTTIMFPNLQLLEMTKLEMINSGQLYNYESFKTLIFPLLKEIRGQSFSGKNLVNIITGILEVCTRPFYHEASFLRNITIGQDTDIDLPFNVWTATNVIAEGQSGIDELNNNLRTNLLEKLYDHSNDGETRILQIGWLDYITPENIAYANAKGWTITN